ncbi:extracellular solute-binding protein [Spirillospora sp. CA-294931]|uniref:extracellular solute-binding protein n=1 Tax=Spirillospora sp. CA-294931 TaxID=3240042 RepID=UPI003D8C7853
MRLRAGRLVSAVTIAAAAATLAACSGEDQPKGTAQVANTLGPGEGALNLVTMTGYLENGGSDPRVDWVTPFEDRTGCKVGWKIAKNAQEMTDIMQNKGRRYDGVSAPPEVAGQLVSTKHITPVNTDLVDGYKKLDPKLRGLLKRDGKIYGVPYVWGSNLLMSDSRAVQPAPTKWAALFDPDQAKKYSGRIVMRDSPMVIAEAALYLKNKDRKLKITDPYSLTRKQLDAATRVLVKQRPHVKKYWDLPADAVGEFAGGSATPGSTAGQAVLGQAWPYQVDVLTRAGKPVQGSAAQEGTTGWMDAWMIGARAQHPNCMYQWLQWTASPDVQQQVAEWSGVAPANPQTCSGDRRKAAFCNAYRIGDRDHIEKIIFAHTPLRSCGGGGSQSDRRDCTDYAEWVKAWTEATKKVSK